MTTLGLVLAFVIGTTLGLLGGGGSILTVPVFVYVLGIAPKPAIAMSLAAVGTTSFVGFLSHWRHGSINLRIAVSFGAFAMVGASGGARLARLIPGTVQLGIFGVVVLVAAVLMWRSARSDLRAAERAGGEPERRTFVAVPESEGAADGSAVDAAGDARRKREASRKALALLAVQGVGVGVLTAIVGVGGGFMIVPALVLLGKLPMRQAVGTSLLVITMNALTAFAGYLGQVPIDWELILSFIAAAAVGIYVGTRLAPRVPQPRLKQVFSLLLLVVGAYVLYRR